MPLWIGDDPVGEAIVDTGGEYELMLRHSYGLEIVGQVEVVAFDGPESVDVAEEIEFTVGGVRSRTSFALIGLSVCDCNGVGFPLFRKERMVLEVDFKLRRARFVEQVPEGVQIPFQASGGAGSKFDSAFVEVEVETASGLKMPSVAGLLDTGSNTTILRRELVQESDREGDRASILVEHPLLGMVNVTATLFDTPGLPDLILGTDVMRAWGQTWFFDFYPTGGVTTVVPWSRDSVGIAAK